MSDGIEEIFDANVSHLASDVPPSAAKENPDDFQWQHKGQVMKTGTNLDVTVRKNVQISKKTRCSFSMCLSSLSCLFPLCQAGVFFSDAKVAQSMISGSFSRKLF